MAISYVIYRYKLIGIEAFTILVCVSHIGYPSIDETDTAFEWYSLHKLKTNEMESIAAGQTIFYHVYSINSVGKLNKKKTVKF